MHPPLSWRLATARTGLTLLDEVVDPQDVFCSPEMDHVNKASVQEDGAPSLLKCRLVGIDYLPGPVQFTPCRRKDGIDGRDLLGMNYGLSGIAKLFPDLDVIKEALLIVRIRIDGIYRRNSRSTSVDWNLLPREVRFDSLLAPTSPHVKGIIECPEDKTDHPRAGECDVEGSDHPGCGFYEGENLKSVWFEILFYGAQGSLHKIHVLCPPYLRNDESAYVSAGDEANVIEA